MISNRIVPTRVRIITLTQQGRHLNLTRKSLCIIFPAKDIVSYGKSILAVFRFVQKGLVHSLANHFQTPVNKVSDLNFNSLKASQGAQNALAGNMWPAGRVFETPALDSHCNVFQIKLFLINSLKTKKKYIQKYDFTKIFFPRKTFHDNFAWLTALSSANEVFANEIYEPPLLL